MLFLIPIAAFVGWRVHANRKKSTVTPERKAIFSAAMKVLKDPTKLEKLADVFDKENLPDYAIQLRTRAGLPNRTEEQKQSYATRLKTAINSKDVKLVLSTADFFHKVGASSTESYLRNYASGLKAAADIVPVIISPNTESPPAGVTTK